MLTPWKKIYDQPRQHIKKQRELMVIFPKITYKYKATRIKISPEFFLVDFKITADGDGRN